MVKTLQQPQLYYFAVNKPKGYLCANAPDPALPSGKLVVDLFRDWIKEWKSTRPPVGVVLCCVMLCYVVLS